MEPGARGSYLKDSEETEMYKKHKDNTEWYTIEHLAKDYRIMRQRIHAILWPKEFEEEEEKKLGRPLDDSVELLLDTCPESTLIKYVGVDLSSQFQGALEEKIVEKETMHVHSPKQDAKVGIQGEHLNEEKKTMPLQSPIQQANVIQQGDECNEDFSDLDDGSDSDEEDEMLLILNLILRNLEQTSISKEWV
ncbi:uncharacterized protein LOC107786919 isoform X1 [Nicotiana tabacum]|uniref:Uncharacterized protein LOC107786919 isoform X1 n=4 Tax=Nicotiana tabacum TaxID=4097 RepID=A0AC58U110_TOBAC|nr:PREDICTED: uncharacterized protein LOC107786919 isoform X1 [Nicotiana tabacum]